MKVKPSSIQLGEFIAKFTPEIAEQTWRAFILANDLSPGTACVRSGIKLPCAHRMVWPNGYATWVDFWRHDSGVWRHEEKAPDGFYH
jgi:hypothetical protein